MKFYLGSPISLTYEKPGNVRQKGSPLKVSTLEDKAQTVASCSFSHLISRQACCSNGRTKSRNQCHFTLLWFSGAVHAAPSCPGASPSCCSSLRVCKRSCCERAHPDCEVLLKPESELTRSAKIASLLF